MSLNSNSFYSKLIVYTVAHSRSHDCPSSSLVFFFLLNLSCLPLMCTSLSTQWNQPWQQLHHISRPIPATMMYSTERAPKKRSRKRLKKGGKKKQNQRVKNDICCCWATSSPPGNDLGFQVSKSEDRLGRVRQTLKGAITTVEKGRVTKRTEKRKKNSSDIIRGLGLRSKMDEEQSDYPHRDRLLWQVEMTWCCGFKRWHRPRVFSCL